MNIGIVSRSQIIKEWIGHEYSIHTTYVPYGSHSKPKQRITFIFPAFSS